MENQEKKNNSNESNDVDLGTLINALGRGLRAIRRAISNSLIGVGMVVMILLIFLKRRIWWLMVALVIGLGYGVYLSYNRGLDYYSVMTAKFNFGSTRALYTTLDYFNALIQKGNRAELSKLLGIAESEAGALLYFKAEPVNDELTISELYNDHFLSSDRRYHIRMDTFWTRNIPYKDFVDKLEPFDYPLQQITVASSRAGVFSRVQEGIIKSITSNGTLKENQEIIRQMQTEEESILVASLQHLDTLRMVYNERLRKQIASGQEASTSVNILDKSLNRPNPELELFDKILEIKDELRAFRSNNLKTRQLVQVYAPLNPAGKVVGILNQRPLFYGIRAVILALLVLILIESYRWIGKYEKEKK